MPKTILKLVLMIVNRIWLKWILRHPLWESNDISEPHLKKKSTYIPNIYVCKHTNTLVGTHTHTHKFATEKHLGCLDLSLGSTIYDVLLLHSASASSSTEWGDYQSLPHWFVLSITWVTMSEGPGGLAIWHAMHPISQLWWQWSSEDIHRPALWGPFRDLPVPSDPRYRNPKVRQASQVLPKPMQNYSRTNLGWKVKKEGILSLHLLIILSQLSDLL